MGKVPILEYKNVFYFNDINSIGGVETMFWNLARKYGPTHDITIMYQQADPKQLERLQKLVHCIKYDGTPIKCEKLFCNFDISPMDKVEAKEYSVIMHSDYHARNIIPPKHEKINRYIGVSQNVCNTAMEKLNCHAELCYNPIVVDKPRKVLHLVSATRLTMEKGKDRMKKLADALTTADIPFVWTVYTNDLTPIDNPNVIYCKPRLDIADFIADADFLVQLSDTEGYSYTVLEALCMGTPVIVTPCPVYAEMGLNEKNSITLPFDMSDIPVKKIAKGLKKGFEYKPHDDRWDELLAPGEGNYREYLKQIVDIKILWDYFDLELNRIVKSGEILTVKRSRAELLIGRGFAEYVTDENS